MAQHQRIPKKSGNASPPIPATPTIRETANHIRVYANSAVVSSTNWDFSIGFGEIVGEDAGKALLIDQSVTVKMSPQHAKAFLGVLRQNIERFEKTFGEIRWQPVEHEKERT